MRTLGAAVLCFLAVSAWTLTTDASLRAEPLAAGLPAAQAAAPAADIYQDVYNGWKWWHVYCYRCHGTDAVGTTTAPNLIDENEKMPRAQFIRIVRDGVKDKGMAAWAKMLDPKQMGQLYVYVRARADKVLPPGRPDEVGPNKGQWVPPADWAPR